MNKKTLYHYTSLDGFKGIVSSNNIWLSNSMKTNDYKEIKWITELLKDMYPKKETVISKFNEEYNKWISDYFRPHICCLSYNYDQLSQWRGYGNDGKGICIGFNQKYFNQIREIENKEFQVEEVIYDLETQKSMVRDFISKSDFFSFIDKSNINGINGLLLTAPILEMGIKFKHNSFCEEQEVRLIHGNNELAAEPDMFNYRFTEDDLISYIEIPLSSKKINNQEKAINEIIIGPKCKITSKELKEYLIYSGNTSSLEVDIKHSNSSYR